MFNEIGLKVGEHKKIYINIEINYLKNIPFQNGSQNNFCHIVQQC